MLKTMLIGTAAAGAMIVAAGSASAQSYSDEQGFYLQGGYSYLDIQPDGADSGVDTNAITARAGYQFNDWFSLESDITTGIDDGEFDYNVDEDEFDLDDNNDGDFNDLIAGSGDIGLNYLVGIYGKAEVPVTERLDAFGRAGYAFIDLDAEIQTPGGTPITTIEDSEDGAALGGGLDYALTDNWNLRGEYTWYGFGNTDTHAAMVSAGYKF
ncbi:porin family protein [Henriciella algicola]|jgi:outer membrane immunogenic protein|uniref:Porin family protein n=1 Tax=Henriciella algicola TaxID=1608422 RepID=A0A399RD54_9PROT|nr:porin family protein [Henriciella algicola]RIJ27419.1 porin family protein [Henriciella algicola]|tara:strand:+ start:1785 stop:2417 length:633 start_codon:yes stop_codon:yes gene_type:complete